jgi:hypothetical protein
MLRQGLLRCPAGPVRRMILRGCDGSARDSGSFHSGRPSRRAAVVATVSAVRANRAAPDIASADQKTRSSLAKVNNDLQMTLAELNSQFAVGTCRQVARSRVGGERLESPCRWLPGTRGGPRSPPPSRIHHISAATATVFTILCELGLEPRVPDACRLLSGEVRMAPSPRPTPEPTSVEAPSTPRLPEPYPAAAQ